MPFVSSGRRRHLVQLQNPAGEAVADGDGGYDQGFETFEEVKASIDPATAENLERFQAGTSVSAASHILTIPYLPTVGTDAGLTTKSRVLFRDEGRDRVFFVRGYSDPEERRIELVLLCQEIVQ